MIPAPALRVQCPHCRKVKELSNLRSGNTFGGIIWSDTKAIYPMLPQNSAVQRCPRCGKYFFLEDAKILPSKNEDDPFFFGKKFSRLVDSLFDDIED